MNNTRVRKLKSNINYLDDSLSRLNLSKQKIEKSISERKRVLWNCECKIASKKTVRDSLVKELSLIEKYAKHRKRFEI